MLVISDNSIEFVNWHYQETVIKSHFQFSCLKMLCCCVTKLFCTSELITRISLAYNILYEKHPVFCTELQNLFSAGTY